MNIINSYSFKIRNAIVNRELSWSYSAVQLFSIKGQVGASTNMHAVVARYMHHQLPS